MQSPGPALGLRRGIRPRHMEVCASLLYTTELCAWSHMLARFWLCR